MSAVLSAPPPAIDLAAIKTRQQGRLVNGQLCRRRHHLADRRREPVRSPRSALRHARARRCRRQRQCHARRSAPLVRGDSTDYVGSCSSPGGRGRSRRARGPLPGSRRREPAFPGRVVRRRDVHLRRDVHPGPGQGRARARARLQARRQDRAGELDAGQLHRAGVQDHRPVRPAGAGRKSPGSGAPRPGSRSSSARPRGDPRDRREFVFRYRSPAHWIEVSAPTTAP